MILGLSDGVANFIANMFGLKLKLFSILQLKMSKQRCCSTLFHNNKGQKERHKESCMFFYLVVFRPRVSLFSSTNICFIGSHVNLRLMPHSAYQSSFIYCCGQASDVYKNRVEMQVLIEKSILLLKLRLINHIHPSLSRISLLIHQLCGAQR